MLWFLLFAYVGASVLSLIMYAIDKSAAQNKRWRISENSLHLLSLAGGWPGAWVAQEFLRHKTSKASFQRMFWLTVLLNLAGLAGLVYACADGEAGTTGFISTFKATFKATFKE